MLLKQTPQITMTYHNKRFISYLSHSLSSLLLASVCLLQVVKQRSRLLQLMMPAAPRLAARSLLRKGKRQHKEAHIQFFTASPASGAHYFCQLPSDGNLVPWPLI